MIDTIELTESESEEIEETDFDDLIYLSDLSPKSVKHHNNQYNKSDLMIIRFFFDVFTPPPEIPAC